MPQQKPNQIPADPYEFLISQNIEDVLTPGVAVEVDAEEAEALGAFEESALSDEAASEANQDLADLANMTGPRRGG